MTTTPTHSARPITILGIETSCDDTAAAIVRRGADGSYEILSNVTYAQHAHHARFGGVVPEIAARAHVETILPTISAALNEANIAPSALDGVAATAGPGLLGGVLVGFQSAKALALKFNLPLLPINHLEGHALSVWLSERVPLPFLLLLVSGGHTQLILVKGLSQYERLGTTIDDAAGEAFDKTAKLLGLGHPGGPKIEQTAKAGNARAYKLPKPLTQRPGCDFSFSGLKTAVREIARGLSPDDDTAIADLAASFQHAAAAHLSARTKRAMEIAARAGASNLVVAGGVAANGTIREMLTAASSEAGWRLSAPPIKLCTDNGAMIAVAGAERMAAGLVLPIDEALATAPKARWPLAPPPKGAEFGSGKKGPKA